LERAARKWDNGHLGRWFKKLKKNEMKILKIKEKLLLLVTTTFI